MRHVLVIALFLALGAIAFIANGPAGTASVLTGATLVWFFNTGQKETK